MSKTVAGKTLGTGTTTPTGLLPAASGMTLRDYFAAQALQGILVGRTLLHDEWAADAYAMADAMLKARGEKK